MSGFGRRYRAFDRFQQRHRWLGFPLAVLQKYADDQGGYLAATITYYAFFAIFPLLLVLTTVLGFVLQSHKHLQQTILNSALGQFPVIGPQLSHGSLRGSTLALTLGLAVALWAGMGVFLAAQNAMNHLWGVPFKRRPNPFRARGRALMLLALLGGGALATTVLAAFATVGARFGVSWKIGSLLLSTALNIGLFWVGFRVLTAREVSWRQLRGGAIAAGVAYELLQTLGGYYVGHTLRNAGNVYGTFGLVIGLLSWVYLSAHITLLAAEGNVVAARRLWPRSFSFVIEQPATDADKRALTQRGKVEERRQDEMVSIDFPAPDRARRLLGHRMGPRRRKQSAGPTEGVRMYATVRSYSGATGLVDALVENEGEVKRLITGIDGFRAYYLIRTGGGDAVSVSVYDDEAGAEQSNREAAAWVRENLPDLSISPPQVLAGDVAIDL